MKIAYISYEHPLGISGGGIGTYTDQIASIMAVKSHQVEVFSSNYTGQYSSTLINGYLLHLIPFDKVEVFRENILSLFEERHHEVEFDLIESPEYAADAFLIKKKYPEIPLVVKLHTPSFLVSKLNGERTTLISKIRFKLGGLLRGRIYKSYWVYDKTNDLEYQQYLMADAVYSPSRSLKSIVENTWGSKRISVIPNPFEPKQSFLALKANNNKKVQVTFIGRLEIRKGIVDLVEAIPMVLEKCNVEFAFFGEALNSPWKNIKMAEYIETMLKDYNRHIKIYGKVNYDSIITAFEQSDICIFPSKWENFPTVCLEAMAAGKPVIGTNNGGMQDMIIQGETGELIDSGAPEQIAKAIISLANNVTLRKKMGIAARKHLLENFNGKKIGDDTVYFYNQVLKK